MGFLSQGVPPSHPNPTIFSIETGPDFGNIQICQVSHATCRATCRFHKISSWDYTKGPASGKKSHGGFHQWGYSGNPSINGCFGKLPL